MDKSCCGEGATHNACPCFLERLARYEKALMEIVKMDTCDADYEEGGPCLGMCPKVIAKKALEEKK